MEGFGLLIFNSIVAPFMSKLVRTHRLTTTINSQSMRVMYSQTYAAAGHRAGEDIAWNVVDMFVTDDVEASQRIGHVREFVADLALEDSAN